MARGGARPGAGRKRGGKNRKTIEAGKRLGRLGVDPARVLVQIMRDPETSPTLRADCAKALLPYRYPRLSTVEHTGDGKPGQGVTGIAISFVQAEVGPDGKMRPKATEPASMPLVLDIPAGKPH